MTPCNRYAATVLAMLLATPSLGVAEDATTAASGTAKQHMYTNRLIDSNDPYLLLHAHNPVDWYPWGDEALARAKRENRPIFVSIGYSTCYWCHVAERLIYSDPEIAKLMNEWFVNIKVDREQRPDLDGIYLLATQTITGRGGWPNNVFLTPDLKPFHAGSYYPPTDDAAGRPGFPTLLRALHEAWVNRPKEVSDRAGKVYQAMLEAREQTIAQPAASFEPADWLTRAREAFVQEHDPAYGGMGNGPAKFPRAPALSLLLADSAAPQALQVLTQTLDALALGGIHDHLGGGFHRYSTERTWSIPHFEKMLYDNAQLLGLYAQAWRITGNPLYRQVTRDVADYLSREMMAPGGGFFAAQDAEVAGREGASYLWNRDEIESTLGEATARRFFDVYALTPMRARSGDKVLASAQDGVLRVRLPIGETVQRGGGQEISQVLASLAPARATLLETRNRRAQPARDDKIVVAWNAMAIDALAQSGTVLQDRRLIGLAEQTANRLWEQAFDPKSGELKHELFGGRAQVHAYLDDYALLGIAFISLADATGEISWQDHAGLLTRAMLRRFDRGDMLATSVASRDLLIPPVDDGDNAAPSGTSAAIELLARMHGATGKKEYADAASRIVARLSGTLAQSPSQWPSTVTALNRYALPLSENTAQRDVPEIVRAPSAPPGTADVVRAHGTVHSAGDYDEIGVTVVIGEGYHVNANPATFEYLIAATLSVDGVPDMQVTYPAAKLIKPQFAAGGLKVYEGTITLKGTAPKGALVNRNRITAALRVQACDDEVCLPPATLALEIKQR